VHQFVRFSSSTCGTRALVHLLAHKHGDHSGTARPACHCSWRRRCVHRLGQLTANMLGATAHPHSGQIMPPSVCGPLVLRSISVLEEQTRWKAGRSSHEAGLLSRGRKGWREGDYQAKKEHTARHLCRPSILPDTTNPNDAVRPFACLRHSQAPCLPLTC
jgi:hypothetical protein